MPPNQVANVDESMADLSHPQPRSVTDRNRLCNKSEIDRSFVKDNGDAAGQNAIIRAITALGVSLGMSTIAEGVETSDQLARIRAEGCTSVQGYLFSKPVPVDQVDALIIEFAARHVAMSASPSNRERV